MIVTMTVTDIPQPMYIHKPSKGYLIIKLIVYNNVIYTG